MFVRFEGRGDSQVRATQVGEWLDGQPAPWRRWGAPEAVHGTTSVVLTAELLLLSLYMRLEHEPLAPPSEPCVVASRYAPVIPRLTCAGGATRGQARRIGSQSRAQGQGSEGIATFAQRFERAVPVTCSV